MSAPLLDAKQLRALALDDRLTFDLSRISLPDYRRLMSTLLAAGPSALASVGFTLDLDRRTQLRAARVGRSGSRGERLAHRRVRPPSALALSAAASGRAVVREVCALLARVLPRAEALSALELRALPLGPADVQLLAAAVYDCAPLRALRLCDVALGDAGFARLARALRRRAVTELQCRACGLTDACAGDVAALLSYHASVQAECAWHASLARGAAPPAAVCLCALDFRDNEFTFEFVAAVQWALRDLPLERLDLRGNAGVSDAVVAALRRDVGADRILTGRAGPLPGARAAPRRPADGPRRQTREERLERIRDLAQENDALRRLAAFLREGSNVVELEPGLTIVGERAGDFVQQIRRLDGLMGASPGAPPGFAGGRSASRSGSPGQRTPPR
jgi:hypothetical protein